MSKYAKLVLYPALVAGVLAAVVLGVRTPSSHAEFTPDSGLLVSTRDHLRVCVDTAAAGKAGVSDRLAGSLAAVRGHAQWSDTRYGDRLPELESGCAATLPAGQLTRGVVVGPGVTDAPGPYRTVVVVLDDAAAERHLGDRPAMLLPYELMRVSDHVVVTVTQAVAVRADFVGEPAFVAEYLTPALGLDPANK